MSRIDRHMSPVLVATALALVLTACGRRGPLEEPPSAAAVDKSKTTTVTEEVKDPDSFASTNVIGKPQRAKRAITIPKRDFILDPLL